MRKWLSSVTGMACSWSGYGDIMPKTKYTLRSRKYTLQETKVGKMIELTASDGHKLSAYRAEPKGKPRGGLIVVQEIFGVNSHIRSIADGYAADGYLAVAPAFFDRAQRGVDLGYSQADIEVGRTYIPKMNWDNVIKDAAAGRDEVKSAGKVGIVGYCWGGTVSWMAAARLASFAPESFTSFAYFSYSVRISASNCSGVLVPTPTPNPAILALTSGDAIAETTPALSLSMIARDVPAGTSAPSIDAMSKPGIPSSAIVGMSGSAGVRLPSALASMRTLPAFTNCAIAV